MGDSVRVNPPPELLRQRMQHGPHHLHVSELATHGLTHDHVRRWVRDGWLESLGNGSYHVVTPPTSENPAVWRRELARRRVAATFTALPDALALYDRRKGVSMARVRRRSRGRPVRVAGGEPAALVVPHLRDGLGTATLDPRRDGPRLRPG